MIIHKSVKSIYIREHTYVYIFAEDRFESVRTVDKQSLLTIIDFIKCLIFKKIT